MCDMWSFFTVSDGMWYDIRLAVNFVAHTVVYKTIILKRGFMELFMFIVSVSLGFDSSPLYISAFSVDSSPPHLVSHPHPKYCNKLNVHNAH